MPPDFDREDTGEWRRSLSASADGVVAELDRSLDGGLTEREAAIARIVATYVTDALVAKVPRIVASIGPGHITRLTALEVWRKDHDAWRLRLTGADDRNGRVGRLDAEVAKLREDVGTSKERDEEKALARSVATVRRYAVAKALGSVVAIVVAAYGYLRVRDDAHAVAAATAAAGEVRLHHVEETQRLLLDLSLRPRTP